MNVSIKKKGKPKKKRVNGFTLVELLAVIAVLSIVLTIVVYSAFSVIRNSKEKSYQVTINNIQTSAGNYLIEDVNAVQWIDSDYGDYQYQCVTVQNLIDAGYFKNDILESMVDDDTYVHANDSIYVERDGTTKSITKSILLVGSASSYSGLCGGINVGGNISFVVNPSNWSGNKSVDIKYKLYNYDKVSNYIYNYSYILDDDSVDKTLSKEFSSASKTETVTINENGIVYAKIVDSSSEEIVNRTLIINKIDNDGPSAVIASTNNVSSEQTVTLTMSDSGSGIKAYYFGKTDPETEDVDWINVANNVATTATGETSSLGSGGLNNYSDTYVVDSDGTWYLGVMDIVGNTTVVSEDFYKTILSITNASVSPSTILTMNGNEFTIPDVTPDAGGVFNGWYTSSSYSGNAITKYSPIASSTLYGKVDVRSYVVTLDNNGATTAGTEKIYEKYGVGVYLDSSYINKMTSSTNKIIIPTKTGYTFQGYYYYSSNTSTSEGAIQLINSQGFVTSSFTNTTFDSDVTLIAKWVDDISPTCTLAVTLDGIIFDEVYDNVGVVSQRISRSVATSDDAIDVSTSESSGSTSTSTDGTVGLLTEGITYGYVEDAAGNIGTCSIDIESAINYSSVSCSAANYSNPESACTANDASLSSKNCSLSYTYTAEYCDCYYDEFDQAYRWRKLPKPQSGLASCKTVVVDYTKCDYQDFNEGYTHICSCAISGSYYSGSITCYTDTCSEGYTRLESSNYCYKKG